MFWSKLQNCISHLSFITDELLLLFTEKVFSFLSQDEVERMKQEEGMYYYVLLRFFNKVCIEVKHS